MPINDIPFNAPHPGEALWEDFLKPLGLSQVEFARHIGVSFRRINEIVNGKRAITPETAFLFADAFGGSPRFWMDLQTLHDLAKHHAKHPVRTVARVTEKIDTLQEGKTPADGPDRSRRPVEV